MSEYWKSTPKYWCKHCETFVVDTKLARTQHDQTGKHQGALKRFLRDLHRKGEKEAQAKESAKREVDRLNGVQSVRGAVPTPKPIGTPATSSHVPSRQATEAERKAQMKQLEDLGVSLPGAVRPDMAMPGEWETVSEAVETAPAPTKRKMDQDEVQEEEERRYRRKPGGKVEEIDIEERELKGWKAKEMTYPGQEDDEDEFVAPLPPVPIAFKIKKEEPDVKTEDGVPSDISTAATGTTQVKQEPVETPLPAVAPSATEGIAFKARKGKNIRKK